MTKPKPKPPLKKRGRGRPQVELAERLTHVRSTRLTDAEAEGLATKAASLGLSEGEVLRCALFAFLKKRTR